MKFLGIFGRHHHSIGGFEHVFEAKDSTQATLGCVFYVLEREHSVDLSPATVAAATAAVEAALKLDLTSKQVVVLQPPDDPDYTFVLWKAEDNQIGIGLSGDGTIDGTDRHENWWLSVKEWTPDPAEVERLQHLPTEDLVQLVLMAKVNGSFDFQPEFDT